MTDEELFRQQCERWDDPRTQAEAQERARAARIPLERLNIQREAMRRAPKTEQRIFWLREMASAWGGAVAPQAACAPGCSSCCYQGVSVSETEAQMIAKETGATYREPVTWRGSERAQEFTGVPCPFLTDDARCTIYASRPFACRTLFNLDRDALLCRIVPGSPISVPYANASPLVLAYVEAHVNTKQLRESFQRGASADDLARAVRWSDLRDFFPDGLK